MKRFGLLAAAMVALTLPAMAVAQFDSRTAVTSGGRAVASAPVDAAPTTSSASNMRWAGGDRAPGGWSAYRTLKRGATLPDYWKRSDFYIGDYARYGLAMPQAGTGWSRYYDDAVLTDRSGRVIDTVRGINWGRNDQFAQGGEDFSETWGYRDDGASRDQRGARFDAAPASEARDRDRGLGGAAIGGAVGAVAGNVIGGRGNRLAGTLLGGAAGAVAGGVIDRADKAGRGLTQRERDAIERDRRSGADYDGGYYGDDYHAEAPHWDRGRSGGRRWDQGRGYPQRWVYRYPQGNCCGGETVITINSAPVTTQTTTTTYTTEYVSYAKKAVRKRHAPRKRVYRPRRHCTCK